jgi:hypothetical protein
MMFIEVFVPKGVLGPAQRRSLAERLITDFMDEDEELGVPPELIAASRLSEQVVVHEPETWVVGGRLVSPDEGPRYVVRVTVPSGWLPDMGQEVIARVSRVLAAADYDPGRRYEEPVAWVQVQGVSYVGVDVCGRVAAAVP